MGVGAVVEVDYMKERSENSRVVYNYYFSFLYVFVVFLVSSSFVSCFCSSSPSSIESHHVVVFLLRKRFKAFLHDTAITT